MGKLRTAVTLNDTQDTISPLQAKLAIHSQPLQKAANRLLAKVGLQPGRAMECQGGGYAHGAKQQQNECEWF